MYKSVREDQKPIHIFLMACCVFWALIEIRWMYYFYPYRNSVLSMVDYLCFLFGLYLFGGKLIRFLIGAPLKLIKFLIWALLKLIELLLWPLRTAFFYSEKKRLAALRQIAAKAAAEQDAHKERS
eukprot:TRINITY_DN2331_c0_g1_i1.p1 TRINITY_DN2331_c0_g1~~TRINITY_DN2331_c0_g1_i1.p1  ORF type:complete len:125 (-),score=28.33 TRINITY_DN2331_c0_g1_i1:22-396(-)